VAFLFSILATFQMLLKFGVLESLSASFYSSAAVNCAPTCQSHRTTSRWNNV